MNSIGFGSSAGGASESASSVSTRLAVFASGRGSNFERLIDSRLRPQIQLFHSNRADSRSVKIAEQAGIRVMVADSADMIELEGIDRIILAGYMRILSESFVSRWAGKIINIHPSLLPQYPGQNAIRRALEAGETATGVTIHEVVAEIDAGPILRQETLPIHPDDTVASLAERIHAMEHRIYSETIMWWLEE